MVELKEIKTADNSYYNYAEELMLQSFPKAERRGREEQRIYTDNNNRFKCNIVLNHSKPVGLVNYWELDGFNYIEHIAIDPTLRNGGYGKVVINKIKELSNGLPILLEVEKGVDEITHRRISFYKRLGFILHKYDYLQPAYREGGETVPLYLMSHGPINMEIEYERVKRCIHQEVYHVIEK
ncbi:MAG: GNAT family N-acetyltransferase [Phocaeicola sp.]